MAFDDTLEPAAIPASMMLARLFRVATQAIGLGLVVVGVYYGVWILVNSIEFATDPARLEARVTAMEKSLDLRGMVVPAGPQQIPVGRPAANAMLLMWYLVGAWMCFKILAVGGQLAMGAISERREFLQTMKEFLVTARHQEAANSTS